MYEGNTESVLPDAGGNVPALTYSNGPIGYEPIMSDCDIVVFSEDGDSAAYSFAANSAPSGSQLDLAYILAHETGHCVGIGDQEHPAAESSLMFWSMGYGVDFAGLPASEVEAVCFLYDGPGC